MPPPRPVTPGEGVEGVCGGGPRHSESGKAAQWRPGFAEVREEGEAGGRTFWGEKRASEKAGWLEQGPERSATGKRQGLEPRVRVRSSCSQRALRRGVTGSDFMF